MAFTGVVDDLLELDEVALLELDEVWMTGVLEDLLVV